MKIILHIGAHRTGTTSFQSYMRRHAQLLAASGIGFWGPVRTRKGLFTGIQPTPGLGAEAARRARGRILLQLDKAQKRGLHTLVVSDENMLGSSWQNLRTGRLYPDAGERLARLVMAFDYRVDVVSMSVRALDHFWMSTASYGVFRGHDVPSPEMLERIAQERRSWQDVVADVSCAAPLAQIRILPFERFVGRADRALAATIDHVTPRDADPRWKNRSPSASALRACLIERGSDPSMVPEGDRRWAPFNSEQSASLREAYADDMHWLTAGANGLATLAEDKDHNRAGQTLPFGSWNRGYAHDITEGRLAQPG